MGRIIFDQQLAYQVVATTATVIAEDGATATAHGSTAPTSASITSGNNEDIESGDAAASVSESENADEDETEQTQGNMQDLYGEEHCNIQWNISNHDSESNHTSTVYDGFRFPEHQDFHEDGGAMTVMVYSGMNFHSGIFPSNADTVLEEFNHSADNTVEDLD